MLLLSLYYFLRMYGRDASTEKDYHVALQMMLEHVPAQRFKKMDK